MIESDGEPAMVVELDNTPEDESVNTEAVIPTSTEVMTFCYFLDFKKIARPIV